ncbi:MAG: HDIG domain-containing metalloprotein [Chloroflexota bacterium]
MSKLTETLLSRQVALVLLGVTFVATATALIAYNALVPSQGVTLAAGQVAAADITAPRSITYESDVLTRLARQAASDAIRDVYDPPNPGVARQQIQLARRILDYMDNVRHDSYATPNQQQADMVAISTLSLNPNMNSKLLTLSDTAWKEVDSQVMGVLERTMRDDIRDNNLDAIYANLPNLVGATVDEQQTDLITAMLKDLIKPNAFYNEELTHEARQQAAAAITTERRSFAQGQVVVRAGTIVTDADMEALTQLKLLQPPDRRLQAIAGALLAVLLISTLGAIYLQRLYSVLFHNLSQMVVLGSLFLVFLAGERIFGTGNDFQSHIYPAAAFSLIIVAMSGTQAAIVLTGALAALVGLITSNSLEYTMLVAVGGMAGILSLHRTERINAYFRAGLIIGLVNVVLALLFELIQGNTDPFKLVMLSSAGMLNGVIVAGVAVTGLYLISNVLNMPTSLRLIELSQPGQPLLQRLLREAPGTYQHSLQVANLAELAAERIGANASLVRVAALYHDIGKIIYPHFFVENQVEGINPHDELDDPYRSAQIIISHVSEGAKMAHKARLPKIFIDCILQHHGTTPVLYFYNRALKDVNCDTSQVDKARFSYPGPRPQTREAAILMLADTSESITRAKRPQTKQEIEEIVQGIIESRMGDEQLDESFLTINDLRVIREVFVSTLQGMFHPRIVYPELPSAAPATPSTVVTPTTNLPITGPRTVRTTQESTR